MKISPLKNYTKPKYAAGLAALLTAAAAVSGCAELAGDVSPIEETSGTEYEEPQADGFMVMPEETTYDDTELAGAAEETEEYEITMLDGDVAVPEYGDEDYDFDRDYAMMSDALSEYDRLRLSYIEDFDTNEACCFNMYDRDSDNTLTFKTPYLIEQYDENNMLWNKTAYIVFCDKSDPTLQFVGGIDGVVKLDGGYLVPLNSGLSFKLLFVEGVNADINEELCQRLADSLAKKVGAV